MSKQQTCNGHVGRVVDQTGAWVIFEAETGERFRAHASQVEGDPAPDPAPTRAPVPSSPAKSKRGRR